jgi:hypothetical protein
MVLDKEKMMLNRILKQGLTRGNHRDWPGSRGIKCRKCFKFCLSRERVDCVDLNDREVTFCFKCYDKEQKN